MNIQDVYNKFGIQPNLQEHMFRVYEIVSFAEKHWLGEILNWEITKKAALLHDLGNVVKFDLDQHPEFLGKREASITRHDNS